MSRLTERKYGSIVSSKREKTQIHCSNFCNNCSQGTGNCNYVREMVDKLADYEDKEEQGLLLLNPEELKTAIIDRMQEFRDEYKQYSESTIDHFGGKADSMEVAMRIVKGAFEEALAKMGE